MTSTPYRGSILLADDDVMMRNRVRTALQQEGYTVLAAADGDEALELSRTHNGPLDLLLSDIGMPRIDGISTYRHMSGSRPGIRVLFMSARLSRQLALPPSLCFLAKPFEMDTLLTKVNDILTIRPPDLRVILVVDHNEKRRNRTRTILVKNGYAVLVAKNVEDAEVVADSIAQIDLIVSGVVFPGQADIEPGRSGVHLAEHVSASKREISTLLISHFHPEMLRNMEGFSEQPEFLQNPFTAEALLLRVRRLLRS
jgi:DNA-binding response OmpR family regulator